MGAFFYRVKRAVKNFVSSDRSARQFDAVDGWLVVILGALVAGLIIFLWTHADWRMALSEARAQEDRPVLSDYVQTGLWWAGFAELFILFFAMMTPWWRRTEPRVCAAQFAKREGSLWERRLWILWILLAVGWAAWLRAPRMEVNLAADEINTARRFVVGEFRRQDDGTLQFKEVSWRATLWSAPTTNNHFFYSVLARLGHEGWSARTGVEQGEFSEFWLRWPALLGGLGSIALLGILLRGLGALAASWWAPWILVWHPWHLRFSAEARGYGQSFFLVLLAVLCLSAALEKGRWRWWLSYGLVQAAALYSFLGSVYFFGLLNGGVTVYILTKQYFNKNKKTVFLPMEFRRLLAANILSLAILLPLLAPTVGQIEAYFEAERVQRAIAPGWVADWASWMAVGMAWWPSDPGNPLHVIASERAGVWILLGFFYGLAAVGVIWLGRRGGWMMALGVAIAGSLPLALVHAWSGGHYLYLWQLVYLIPLFAAAIGLGGQWCFEKATHRAPIFLPILGGLVVTAGYGWWVSESREVWRYHSKEPIDAVVAHLGGAEALARQERLVAGFWTDIAYYAPEVHYTPFPDDLLALMERSHAEGKELWLVLRNRSGARATLPATMHWVENDDYFILAKKFEGLEQPQFNYYLYEMVAKEDGLDAMRSEIQKWREEFEAAQRKAR